MLKKRCSVWNEGGQNVQELNPFREGKYWDDAKGGWLDPILVRKAREEEMQYVKKHLVCERGPHEPVLEGDGEEPHQETGWVNANKGTSESQCNNISLSCDGVQYWTGFTC